MFWVSEYLGNLRYAVFVYLYCLKIFESWETTHEPDKKHCYNH